jgi:hypothetical protein
VSGELVELLVSLASFSEASRMLTSLITGLFALAGVSLGVALEPVKALVAQRSKSRQERAERCARLVVAATSTRTLLIALNLRRRREAAGVVAEEIDADEIVRQYRSSRADLRQAVALIQLSGPDDLAAAAEAVRGADRDLRAQRRVVDRTPHTLDEDALPPAVLDAAIHLDEEIRRFALKARKYTN